MLELLLDSLSVVLELVVYYFFFRCFFGKGKFSAPIMVMVYLGIGMLSLYLSVAHPIGFIRRLGYFSVVWLLAICYKGNLFMRFFLSFLFQTISMMIEQNYAALLQPVRATLLMHSTYGEYIYYLIGILLSNFTILLLIKLFSLKKDYILQHQNSIKFPVYALLLLLFPQGMHYSVSILLDLLTSNDAYVSIKATFAITLLTFFTIAYFFVFGFILQYQQKQQENVLLQKQIEQERRYHEILLTKHQQLQSLRHDVKRQFDTIASLLCGEHIQEALTIAKNQSGKLAMTTIVQSGNPLVDTVLTIKEDQAQQAGTRFKCHISAAIDVGNIAADDLASLLGNVLDNAIEAVAKIPRPEDREIRCRLEQNDNHLYIIVHNTVAEDIAIVNNHIATTKAHKELHGYGLISIKNIVQKYGGKHQLKCINKIFTIKIILPVDMEDEG